MLYVFITAAEDHDDGQTLWMYKWPWKWPWSI